MNSDASTAPAEHTIRLPPDEAADLFPVLRGRRGADLPCWTTDKVAAQLQLGHGPVSVATPLVRRSRHTAVPPSGAGD
jgi:hypothetical protein